jgi:CubicO group peptidase (beta-lactamase class C family)
MPDDRIRQLMNQHNIPGLGLGVAQGGRVLLQRGYGYADLEHRVPADSQTVWELASITKLFTAQGVMILHDERRLDIDDPLGDYLDDLPPLWQPIRIRHILSHQSGIRSYTEMPNYWRYVRYDRPREAILDLVRKQALLFEPGERVAYDNTGYYLLGYLIEAVSGMAYDEFLDDRVFIPLQMMSTRINDPYQVIADRAEGYSFDGKNIRKKEYYSAVNTFSAGALLSTVEDVVRWGNAFRSGRLMQHATRDMMLEIHPSRQQNERDFHYSMGLGWFLVDMDNGRTFAGHNGAIKGFSTSLMYFVEEDVIIVMLCNQGSLAEPHRVAYEAATALIPELAE